MRAGCHIEVLWEIATKRTVISVRTTDNACFAWSVVAALYPAEEHVDRESYPHYGSVESRGHRDSIFPMTLKDISRVERSNAVSDDNYELGLMIFETYHTIPNVNRTINFILAKTIQKLQTIPEDSYKMRDINEFLKRAILRKRIMTRLKPLTWCVMTIATITTMMMTTARMENTR
ncbi:hypothetical protein ALC56_07527 [Trachymyrmex septentrionalis]|uniref:Uncharacterized protein n=1 Tax=Trachymyrmex septentrionalis TaxID=34720 RepID=A0A195FD49_9HYME|nr:hypothetical protein ALC56_07527 [Trachymyrmex septentrionalis]